MARLRPGAHFEPWEVGLTQATWVPQRKSKGLSPKEGVCKEAPRRQTTEPKPGPADEHAPPLRPTLPVPDLNGSWVGGLGAGDEDVEKKGDRALTLRGSQERLLSLEIYLSENRTHRPCENC